MYAFSIDMSDGWNPCASCTNITNYPDNVLQGLFKKVSTSGVYVFGILDSLKYTENLKFGVDAAGSIGGFVEGTHSYIWDVSDTNKCKYDLEYYIYLKNRCLQHGRSISSRQGHGRPPDSPYLHHPLIGVEGRASLPNSSNSYPFYHRDGCHFHDSIHQRWRQCSGCGNGIHFQPYLPKGIGVHIGRHLH